MSTRPALPHRPHPRDAKLLAEVDEAFGQLSGPTTKETPRHQHEVFGDKRFERLARISNGHIYNLRRRRAHRRARTTIHGTRGAPPPSERAASPGPTSSALTPSTPATAIP